MKNQHVSMFAFTASTSAIMSFIAPGACRATRPRTSRVLTCVAHVVYPHPCTPLKTYEIGEHHGEARSQRGCTTVAGARFAEGCESLLVSVRANLAVLSV
jgi:hypothetical protein